jgi:DNA-binding cell septation regulator SpoVG
MSAPRAAGFGLKPPPRGAKILRLTPYRNAAGTMAGFISAGLPSGMVVHGLKLMVGPQGKFWIATPDQKRRDQDDQVVLDARGKAIWDAVIEFRDRNSRDKFNETDLEALRRDIPRSSTGRPGDERAGAWVPGHVLR